MNSVIINAATVDQAISQGLIKLNIKREEAEISIKYEGKKGLFGFGKKDAIVIVSKKEIIESEQKEIVDVQNKVVERESISTTDKLPTIEVEKNDGKALKKVSEYQLIVDYLENVTRAYGAPANVVVKRTSKKLIFQINTEKTGLLIGKHGKIINALQVLAQTLNYREEDKGLMVVVDVGDYRKRREEKLKSIADKSANKVLKTKQSVILEPLPPFERKIVHARLSRYDNITTHSEGSEPHRYLIVSYKD